jgi:thioredoxin-like negative regulator of GroEL
VIDELTGLWRGKIRVAKLNVDQNPQTAARFQIKSIPTLLIFDRGRLVETFLGALSKDQIARKMAPYLQDRR